MAEAIRYCDACGKIVLPSDIERGAAFANANGTMCPACVANLPPEQRASLVRPASRLRKTPRPGGRSVTPREGSRRVSTGRMSPVPRKGPNTVLAVAGGVAGLLLGVAIVVVVAGGSGPDASTSRSAPAGPSFAVPAPVPPAPPPSVGVPSAPEVTVTPATPTVATGTAEAAKRLAEIRELVTPDYRRYADIVDGLTELIQQYPDAPATVEARTLLAETHEGVADLARAEFEKTRATARELTSSGRYSTAISLLRSLRPRFGDTAWYRDEGEAAVKAAIEDVEDERDRIQKEAAAAVAGGTPLFSVSFGNDRPDAPPATSAAESEGVSILPTSLSVDANETAVVRASAAGFDSNVLQITDTNTGSGKPNVSFQLPQPVQSGMVVVSWRSAITGYTGPDEVDTMFTFRFLGKNNDPVFGVTFVKDGGAGSGIVSADFSPRPQRWAEGARQNNRWSVGGPRDEIMVILDLDNAHATMKRNDRVIVDKTPLDRGRLEGGLRGMAILDGWAAGSRGGGFVAVVDDVRISIAKRAP